MLDENVWICFQDSVPEFGKYRQSELEFLAEQLLRFDYTATELEELHRTMLVMPLGVMQRIIDKRVVRVVRCD